MRHDLKLGNDIVDFSLPDCNEKYKDQRFLKRIFSLSEQAAISSAKNPNFLLWALWAAKEAAFKACQKAFFPITFSHKKFAMTHESLQQLEVLNSFDTFHAELYYEGNLLALMFSSPELRCVHCIAVLTKGEVQWKEIVLEIEKYKDMLMPDTQSSQVRRLASQLFEKIGLESGTEICRKNVEYEGRELLKPPVLQNKNKSVLPYEISLSHDGHWGAVVVSKV
jgi:phosphopantetheine--protein transferase-like protein